MGATTTKKFHNKIKREFVKKIEKLGMNEEQKKIMLEVSNLVERVEVMLGSLYSLLSQIDEYGMQNNVRLFLPCAEKLKAIRKKIFYARQDLENDIDYDEIVKKLEKMPADFWKMEN